VNLLTSNKYTEKQIGYLFISVLISGNSELIQLIVQNIKNDLGKLKRKKITDTLTVMLGQVPARSLCKDLNNRP
jgi:hypothetical protein